MSFYLENVQIRNSTNYSRCLSNVPCTSLGWTDACKSTEISDARKLGTFIKTYIDCTSRAKEENSDMQQNSLYTSS